MGLSAARARGPGTPVRVSRPGRAGEPRDQGETPVVRLMTQRQQIVRWYRTGVATPTGLDEPGGSTPVVVIED
jgi:hypothetical protein